MATAIYEELTENEKREVRMYGVTVAGMRERSSQVSLLSCQVLKWWPWACCLMHKR